VPDFPACVFVWPAIPDIPSFEIHAQPAHFNIDSCLDATVGQLVLDRHTIYLYADVLDSPDVCWENPEVDPLYKRVVQFLELSPRVELLNRRVEVVRELLRCAPDKLLAQMQTNDSKIWMHMHSLDEAF
jgi:hypothetical protein